MRWKETQKTKSKKQAKDNTIKDVRNARLKKENEAVKHSIIKKIKNLFEHQEEDYYKPVRIGNFLSANYIEYESNDDGNKTLSIKKYLNEI